MNHIYSGTPLKQVVVRNNEQIAPDVYLLTLDCHTPFTAGQTIKLAMDWEMPPRVYSLCSGPDDPSLQVLFNIQHGGLLSPKLAQLQPGDLLLASEPYGTFVDQGGPGWWIATGTGIAPFRSMLRAGQKTSRQLLHGARHANQFYFEEEFSAHLGEHYIRCCSAETADNAYHGRVSAYLEAYPELPADATYYLCGSAIMIVEVRDLLISRGIPFTQILSEIYF
jgi:ferredoxin--NADP+ reductase